MYFECFPDSLVSVQIHLKPDYFWPKKEGYSMKCFLWSVQIYAQSENDLASGKDCLDSFLSHKE